ncbi:sterol desaturase family protein [Nocardioides litoris]|uniref:sterol desaturase family protein n=1 Tax=Nocardioides litoris TaxID=1926648 RepID=UPI0011207338|nr:sterol desaturase family protein [Nocardioides litoris]
MHDLLDPLGNPVTYALPFFALTILLELAALRWLDHDEEDGRPLTGYERRDTQASLAMGAISLVFSLALKVGSFVVYTVVFAHLAPWTLPTGTWWYWVLLVVVIDLSFYCSHRFVHRVNIGWAAHQAHHSSEHMNFATALRQKWNPWFEFFFWLPLPFLGFAPWTIYVAFGVNLVFQFFVHTELVGKLPRPIELVLNTPSHHRVHHGSDPEYLDANFGGMLIVWDRVFGTFVEERQRPTYGLTKPVETYNIFALQYGDYAAIWRDVRSATCWRHRLGHLLGPPGWRPDRPGEELERVG